MADVTKLADHYNKQIVEEYKNPDGTVDSDAVLQGVIHNVEHFLELVYGHKQAASVILTLEGDIHFTTNSHIPDLPPLLRGIADSIEKGEVKY